jgi:hypothetical protein
MNTLALASRDRKVRGELARYLEAAGFVVAEHDAPPRVRPSSLVWLTDPSSDPDEIATTASVWLAAGVQHVVIVTWRPAMLRPLCDAHGARLAVLPPPVFGWQVVDALRADDGGPTAA